MASIIKPLGGLATHLSEEEITDLAELNARTLLRHLNYQPHDIYQELLRYQQYLGALVDCLRPAASIAGTPVARPIQKGITLSVTVHDTPDGPAGTDWWMLDRRLEPAAPPREGIQVLRPLPRRQRGASGLSA